MADTKEKNRIAVRFSDKNFDYLSGQARESGVTMAAFLNVLVTKVRQSEHKAAHNGTTPSLGRSVQ